MRTGSTLLPGKRGTRNLVKKYGEALLCVRYRYDADRRKRYKTIELIIDEAPWEPPDYVASQLHLKSRIAQ